MLYRLYTTKEEKFFSDFMELINHLEKNYPTLRYEFRNDAYQLYNVETDERIGYYEII